MSEGLLIAQAEPAVAKALAVAFFLNKNDNQPKQQYLGWSEITEKLTTHQQRQRKDGAAFSPVRYRADALRSNGGVDAVTMAVVDIDRGVAFEESELRLQGYAYIAYSTHSHTEEEPRYRIVIPFQEEVPRRDWPGIWKRLFVFFGGLIDPSDKDASRIYYLPSCRPGAASFVKTGEGRCLAVGDLPKPSADSDRLVSPSADTAAVKVTQGERNTRMASRAGSLRRAGASQEAIRAALQVENRQQCDPPLPDEEISRIAASVARYPAGDSTTSQSKANGQQRICPVVVRLSDVVREEIDWLWPGRIARGKLTIIEGDPGAGKSFLSLAIAKSVTLGQALPPGESSFDAASVLMLTAEDGLADTVRPRAEDMGADVSRIHVVEAVRDQGGQERLPSLTDDLAAIEELLATGTVGLLIIDPINAYLGVRLDTHRDAALRAALTPLAKLAERNNVAMCCICHLTKGGRDKAIYRAQGSIGYVAAARSVLLVAKNPKSEEERVVAVVKNNVAKHPPSLAFTITDGRFEWQGESSLSAQELLGPEEGHAERSALTAARDFLNTALADGPRASKDVEREAEEDGISRKTLYRARKEAGIQARPRGQKGKRGAVEWTWFLPEDSNGRKHSHGQESLHSKNGHLNLFEPDRTLAVD